MPTRPTDALHYHEDPIDWERFRGQGGHRQAQERLQRSAEVAARRSLKEGARWFRPSLHLVNAINAAIEARSPLLLTGDPGTGKTQVAWYLARYFDVPLFDFQVRSESTARDLRWDFDAVAYMRDAWAAAHGGPSLPSSEPDPRADEKYLKHGKLWQALDETGECVLLIDEIDKAPRDFPNDLLQELADYRFEHPFLPDRPIEGRGPPPICVITSNDERRLPDPFLRRCIVHHIELNADLLGRVLGAWSAELARRGADAPLQQAALERFEDVIERLKDRGRPPGVAELLIWLTVLGAWGTQPVELEAAVSLVELPGKECLIKDHADLALLGD